ncbi:hypothetical protein H6503_01780 [Candidatus Woesearchaeota archaeon]|nr:hypothetical protein [Candidatus Woesearchaeota archaeon]
MKLLKNKKAQDGSALQLPMQAFIEILIIASVGLAFFAYGVFIFNDHRIYQTFLAKDVSLLQDAVILSDHDVDVMYLPKNSSSTRMSTLLFDMKMHHTDVIMPGDNPIAKSYIHFTQSGISSLGTFPNSGKLFLKKESSHYTISNDSISVLGSIKCPDVKMFKADLQRGYFFFEGFNGIDTDPFFSDRSKYLRTSTDFDNLPATSTKFHAKYISESRSNIVVFVPSGDKSKFGCELASMLSGEGRDVTYIESDNMDSLYYNVIINADPSHMASITGLSKEIIS